jgi:hypothetical protein
MDCQNHVFLFLYSILRLRNNKENVKYQIERILFTGCLPEKEDEYILGIENFTELHVFCSKSVVEFIELRNNCVFMCSIDSVT